MPTSASDHEGLAALGVALPPQTARKPGKHMKQLFSDTGQQAKQGCYPWGKRNKRDEPEHCPHCCLEAALKTQSRAENPKKPTVSLSWRQRTEFQKPICRSRVCGVNVEKEGTAETCPGIGRGVLSDLWLVRTACMGKTLWNGWGGGGGTTKRRRLSNAGSSWRTVHSGYSQP